MLVWSRVPWIAVGIFSEADYQHRSRLVTFQGYRTPLCVVIGNVGLAFRLGKRVCLDRPQPLMGATGV